MSKTTVSTPRDFFLHLLLTVTLFVSIISFISLIFQYINAAFPDQLNYYFTGISETIRGSTAALLVVFPVYLITSWLIGRDMAKEPEKRQIWIRRWLMNFTLFVAAVTIIVDLVTLIYNYLGGELSIQFFFKILTVLIVAGAVFGYYLWDLRRADKKSKIPKTLAWVTSLVVLGSIISGFFVVGSPSHQRARRFDERRINDLNILQSEIINYWVRKETLPTNLDQLGDQAYGFVAPKDPETEQPYDYTVTSPLAFELCATFTTKYSSKVDYYKDGMMTRPMMPYYGPYQQNWEHEAGRQCFKRTIDPELYKNNPEKIKRPL